MKALLPHENIPENAAFPAIHGRLRFLSGGAYGGRLSYKDGRQCRPPSCAAGERPVPYRNADHAEKAGKIRQTELPRRKVLHDNHGGREKPRYKGGKRPWPDAFPHGVPCGAGQGRHFHLSAKENLMFKRRTQSYQ